MNTVSLITESLFRLRVIGNRTYNTEGFVNPDDLDQKFMQANNRQERQYIPTRTESTYKKLSTQYNTRHCSAPRHNATTSYENWQPKEVFRARTRKEKIKFYRYYY